MLHAMEEDNLVTEVLLFHHNLAEEDVMLLTKFKLATNNHALLTASCQTGLLGLHVMLHAMEADKQDTVVLSHQPNLVELHVVLLVMFNNATTNHAQ